MGSSGTQNRLKDALNAEGEPYRVVIFGLTNTLFSCKSSKFGEFSHCLAFRGFLGGKSEWQKSLILPRFLQSLAKVSYFDANNLQTVISYSDFQVGATR